MTSYISSKTVNTRVFRQYSLLSGIGNVLFGLLSRTPLNGAQTTLYCALAPATDLVPGGYYSNCKVAPAAKPAGEDMELAKKLWEYSEQEITKVRSRE